jgi:cytoskeletal protein CcmA (bactofilin family)
MWKRDEQQKPASPAPPSPAAAAPAPQPDSPPRTVAAQAAANDGSSLRVKGEISASEDLVLHGRIEGKVSLPGHVLTIGPQAQITAEIVARTLIIQGSMNGNVTATERFEIRPNGRMTGDVTCPSVVMNEGSEFSGRVDMRRSFAHGDTVPKDGDRRRDGSTT